MALLVTGDNVRVDINKDSANDNFFSVRVHSTTCASATEVMRVDDHGDLVIYGSLDRADAAVTFDRLGAPGTIVEFGTVSGAPASFTKVAAINQHGQANFEGDTVLPVDSGAPSGGSSGDVRLANVSGSYRLYYNDNGTWRFVLLPN